MFTNIVDSGPNVFGESNINVFGDAQADMTGKMHSKIFSKPTK
jgi:hypothetical protein